MEKEREITFDDINPMDYTVDKLTTADELKEELYELIEKKKKRELERDEAEAEQKRLDEIKAEAEKLIEEKEAEN